MRIIFNTTFIIPHVIEKEWVRFMFVNHVSDLKKNTELKDVIFSKVDIEQPEGETYSLQVVFDSEMAYERYLEHGNELFVQLLIKHYKDSYLCFSSTMREIDPLTSFGNKNL